MRKGGIYRKNRGGGLGKKRGGNTKSGRRWEVGGGKGREGKEE